MKPHAFSRLMGPFLRCLLLPGFLSAAGPMAGAGEGNPFFAMDTIARGRPETVVPLLKSLGYDGLGGTFGDAAMAAALQKEALVFFNGYATLSFAEGKPLPEDFRKKTAAMKDSGTVLWLAIAKVEKGGAAVGKSDPAGDEVVLPALRAMADELSAHGCRLALYPHTGFWMERVEDAGRLADALDRADVGVTFNLCHWLKVEGSGRDPVPVLKAVLPRLMFVTINGADGGDTKGMGWDRLIQPLGRGSYDVAGFVTSLRGLGYEGPVGFQGFGIREDPASVLKETMEAWKRMTKAE
jgi:sugar phosphate isomerase/epimerase